MKKNMKANNKGFSLVELIIAIAIMAILVGVLAPQFIKYVDQSRRSRDISTAQEIRESVLVLIADNKLNGSTTVKESLVSTTELGSTLIANDLFGKVPAAASDFSGVKTFEVEYNAAKGTCKVYLGSYELTDDSDAQSYKNGVPKSDS